MEKYDLIDDILVFCTTAASFPDGILEAHQRLHALVPFSQQRKYFGISFSYNTGKIIYKAAANELVSGELSQHGLEKFILKKGKYICILIKDYMTDIAAIGKAFAELLQYPEIDPQGACVEWYISDKDVQCMIRLQ